MGPNTKHFYEFGPFYLEPSEHLFLQNDRPVPLTPKAFDLLVFLVQNPGRLVTKDQIMQAVWPDSFVEEANLTVWISVLRKTLGDREGGSRYIETVPKKGYRFTAQVKEATLPQSGASQTREVSVAAGARVSGAQVDAPRVVAGSAPEVAVDSGQDERVAPPRPALPEGVPEARRQLRIAIPVLAFLLCLAAAMGYIVLSRKSSAKRNLPSHTLAILPFRNLQPDASNDFLGYSLADAAITKMGYVSSVTVRPSTAIEKYRDQPIDIHKVAAELNVDTILTGNLVRDGDDIRITYQVVDVRANKIVGQGTVDLKYNKLMQVQDSVAQEVITALKLNLTPSEAEQIKPDTAVNPLAYEYFLRGVDLHGQHNFPMAIKVLEKSTQLDPNYAPAWAYLGASYTSDAAFELGGREQYRRAEAAYERALTLRPALMDARIFLANLLVDEGKVEQAVPLVREALKTNSNYADAHWELGYAYRFAGMLNESVAECERALELDPTVKANGSVLNTYLYLGEYDKFLRSLPDADSSFLLFYRGLGEYYQKHLEQAAKDFDRAFELDPSLYAHIGKALSASIGHKPEAGLEMLRALEQKIAQRDVGDPEARYKIAQAYAVLGDKVSALRVLRSSVEGGFFSYPYLVTDPLLDPVRKDPEFTQILIASQRRYEAFRRNFF